jgi:hypothetical protein
MWKYIAIEDEVLPVNSDNERILPASPDNGGAFEDGVKTHFRLFR